MQVIVTRMKFQRQHVEIPDGLTSEQAAAWLVENWRAWVDSVDSPDVHEVAAIEHAGEGEPETWIDRVCLAFPENIVATVMSPEDYL